MKEKKLINTIKIKAIFETVTNARPPPNRAFHGEQARQRATRMTEQERRDEPNLKEERATLARKIRHR